jgi:uncharacterized membrane protein YeaQ/YmgE (transglycosylase-associated protein family)
MRAKNGDTNAREHATQSSFSTYHGWSTDHATRGFFMHMSNEGLLVILFVGLVAGWLAGQIVRGTGFGIIGDILVGIAGALVASLLFPRLGLHLGSGLVSEIIYSAIGAILLLLIVRLVRTGGRF